MSESFKPLDPLSELDRLAFDLDFDLDFAPEIDPEIDLDVDLHLARDSSPKLDTPPQEAQPYAKRKVRILPVGIRSLSNSPGCAPAAAFAPGSTTAPSEALREDRPRREREAGSASEAPASAQTLQPIRRARAVRVDAWAVPASANWTRPPKAGHKSSQTADQKSPRTIRRVSRSTNWALPF